MLKLLKLQDVMGEMETVDDMKHLFSYPEDFFEATLQWVIGDDTDGEIFYIAKDGCIVGITGWYSINQNEENDMFGLRWHGILPEYRGNDYSKQAIDMLYVHLTKTHKKWVKLYEIANKEKTSQYFIKNNFLKVDNSDIIKQVVGAGGEIGDSIVLEYNASRTSIEILFECITSIYDMDFERGVNYYGDDAHNYGACSSDTIFLAPFDDERWEKAAAFHELGHKLSESVLFTKGLKKFYMSTLSKEGAAWEIGFNEMAKAGFILHYKSPEYQFARKCLSSYVGGEYDDVTILNDSLKEHTLQYKIDKILEQRKERGKK